MDKKKKVTKDDSIEVDLDEETIDKAKKFSREVWEDYHNQITKEVVKNIIGVEPLEPPEKLKKLLYKRWGIK